MGSRASGDAPEFRRRLEEIFFAPDAPEVFHSVAHRHEVWREDPFDVASIHGEARDVFDGIVHRATTPPGTSSGRILLLLGESGSGKTHLMRAFRTSVHGRGAGYFGYMQMSSSTSSYARYILRNLLDSLDHPYFESRSPASGLFRLSTALAEACPVRVRTGAGALIPTPAALAEEGESIERAGAIVRQAAEELVRSPSCGSVDIDLIAALLFLQTGNPLLKNLVLKYLRCEDLSEVQRKQLGGMAPKVHEEDPIRLIEGLGRLMWATHGNILVLALDQLEDVYDVDDARIQFRRIMTAVREIADAVPSSAIVISCLEDYYVELRKELTRSLIDRVERDPEPVKLRGARTAEEVRLLVEFRLRWLYESKGIEVAGDWPRDVPRTYPILEAELDAMASLRARDVLDRCREFRTGGGARVPGASPAVPPDSAPPGPAGAAGAAVVSIEQAWNDALAEAAAPPPGEESLPAILARALQACGRELEGAPRISASVSGNVVLVDGAGEPIAAGICERSAAGGGLARQIEALEAAAGGRRVVIVRSTEFPRSARTKIAAILGDCLARGGRRAVVQDSEWRAMIAFEMFERTHGKLPEFDAWRRTERPLRRLHAIQAILGLDGPAPSLTRQEAPPERTVPPPVVERTAAALPIAYGERAADDAAARVIIPGQSKGRVSRAIEIGLSELTRHVAFLGGTGSGKTTAAMNCVEQLILLGIPSILVDRKGDLCSWADPGGRREAPGAGRRAESLGLLREAADVAVYTPGDPRGRPLSIPLVPAGLHHLPEVERDQLVGYAAAAIASMMGYGERSAAQKAQAAILRCALSILCRAGRSPGIGEIIDVVHDRDPELLDDLGHLDPKHCDRLVNDLETLRITKGSLFDGGGDAVDVERLLGLRDGRAGKTRISIISTKFLPSARDVEFWMTQFLVAVGRWISVRPAATLQAVLVLDEADLYLPATSKPPTKEPLESLLKRARSAGLGLFLATQSPGDLDYKCRDNIRTWIIGRVKETTALAKLAPMLGGSRDGAADRLPGLEPGNFYLVRDGGVEAFKGRQSLIAPEQVPEERILELARRSAGGA